MFGSPDTGINTTFNSSSVGTLGSVNSSDEDMIDIQHTGTTSDLGSTNGRLTTATGSNRDEEVASTPMGSSVDDLPEPGMGQYDDFHTIDWQRDIARDRMRHRHIVKKKKNSLCDLIRGAHDAWSGWLCVLLVGLCSGVMAGIIDIGATWLTDIKFGICPSAFYLNREQCCWSSNETVIDISGNCSLWKTWPEIMGSNRYGAGPYTIAYFFYVLWALIFASLAACLVRMFAPYGKTNVKFSSIFSVTSRLCAFQPADLVSQKLKPF